jgi:hypothetical protein
MENIEDFKKKHINLERFLFIYKEPGIHNQAFFGKTSLKAGVLIGSIINLIAATAILLHSIENYKFTFFLGYFLPSLFLAAGSVLLMLSIEHLDDKKAYWGYLCTAFAAWTLVALNALSLVLSFFSGPSDFFKSLFGNLLLITFMLGMNLYTAWIDYCYTKHLGAGHKEVVETGRAEGLISREQGPGVTDNTGAKEGNTNNDIEINVGKN